MRARPAKRRPSFYVYKDVLKGENDMQNWSSDENDAMRGYLIYAGKLLINDGDSGFNEEHLKRLLQKLYRATDNFTADEAQQYYLNSEY